MRASECEKNCPECAGPGVAIQTHKIAPGFVQQMQMRDDRCIARGKCWNKRCSACPNGPTETDTTTLQIELQKGMRDGESLMFEEVADEALGHKPGDLILTIETLPHPDLTRRADDLLLDMDITLLEALVGFETAYTHLDGHSVPIVRTGITSTGGTMVLQNEGMPRRVVRGQSTHGSLTIKFNVVFPKALTDKQRTDIEAILREVPGMVDLNSAAAAVA